MFPRQGGNPAGVYDKYDLHNKARLWEKDHTARSAAGNTFSFIKNRGRAKYYGRGKVGGGGFVAAQTEVSAGGPGSLFATCHNNPAGNQDTFTDNIFRLRGGEKKTQRDKMSNQGLKRFYFVTKEEKQLQARLLRL